MAESPGNLGQKETPEVIIKESLEDPDVAIGQKDTGNRVLETAGEVVYSEWKGGLKPYRILKASDTSLEAWKQEIDGIIAMIRTRDITGILESMNKNGRKKGDHREIQRILEEEKLDETDIILFAIGLFLLKEKSPWKPIEARLKLLKGGDHKMEDFFTPNGKANCYDISATVKELAKLYGIEGNLEGKWIFHSFFATTDGRVSDPMYGWRRAGLFHSQEEHAQYIQEIRQREGLVGRVVTYLKSKEKS